MPKTTPPLPPDWYDSFEARGQTDQDRHDLEQGLLPDNPAAPQSNEPTQPATFSNEA